MTVSSREREANVLRMLDFVVEGNMQGLTEEITARKITSLTQAGVVALCLIEKGPWSFLDKPADENGDNTTFAQHTKAEIEAVKRVIGNYKPRLPAGVKPLELLGDGTQTILDCLGCSALDDTNVVFLERAVRLSSQHEEAPEGKIHQIFAVDADTSSATLASPPVGLLPHTISYVSAVTSNAYDQGVFRF